MRTEAIFYHAGCPVCVDAEQNIARARDRNRFVLEIVHLGHDKSRLTEAERAGVKSVPAIVLDGHAFHINHGADLGALKDKPVLTLLELLAVRRSNHREWCETATFVARLNY